MNAALRGASGTSAQVACRLFVLTLVKGWDALLSAKLLLGGGDGSRNLWPLCMHNSKRHSAARNSGGASRAPAISPVSPLLGSGLALAAGALLVAAPAFAADPFAEGVRTTDPLTPEQQQKTFRAPPGFEVQLVAAEPDLRKPMNLAFDAKGRLWYTESREYPFPAPVGQPARDTIRIASDFDENGRARKIVTFAEGLNIPIGIYPYKNGCIAWSIPNIWWFEDTDGDGKADKKEMLYGPFDHTRDTHGNQASFRRGWDGWLYATHGFNNDSHVKGRDGHQVDMNSGNTYRIRLHGERIEQHTHGQVNPFGLAWDIRGNLYSSDCHSAPIYQLLSDGYYPSFGKPNDGLGFAPVLMEHAHGSTAIDGMVYYNDDLWPADFLDNVFIGNVMTSRLNRDRLTFKGSSPVANELPDFVTSEDPWFRPVDNQLGPDGALYIADFYNRIIGHYEVPLLHPGRDRERGRIWRVVYKGADGKARLHDRKLDLTKATGDQLVAELRDPNLTWRMLAVNELADRVGKEGVAPVNRALRELGTGAMNAATSRQTVHLLWFLYRFDALETEMLQAGAKSADDNIRVHTLRILKELTTWGTPHSQLALAGLEDKDHLARRCAAEALGAHPQFEYLPALLNLRRQTPAEDTHLVYVVRKALRDHLKNEAILTRVLGAKWSPEDRQFLADVAVAVPSANASTLLLRELPTLSKAKDPMPPVAEVLKHAARYAPENELGQLSTFARQQLPKTSGAALYSELERQFALFKSVEQGLQQRGTALPATIRDWGHELVKRYVGSQDGRRRWTSLPYEPSPTENPWDFDNRAAADGSKRRLLSSYPHGEGLTGLLRSPVFEAPEKLSFWLCGHDGMPPQPPKNKNRVRLRLAETGETIAETAPPRDDVAQRVTWETGANRGKRVFVEVQDGDTGESYSWLAFGGFEPADARLSPPEFSPRKETDWFVAAADAAGRLNAKEYAAFYQDFATPRSGGSGANDPTVATAAARAWLAIAPDQAVAALAKIVERPDCEPVYRDRLAELLAERNTPAAQAAVANVIKSSPTRQQERLSYVLAGTPFGAETLLAAAESGSAPARLLQRVGTKNRVMAAKPANAEARIASLTKGLAPLSDAAQKLIDSRRAGYDPAKATAARGLEVFNRNCRVCHQLEGQGALVGPQLDGIGNRGMERLFEDILDPNRNVDRAFRTTLYTLQDGDVTNGLFRREEGEMLVLADSTGKEVSVPKKQVKNQRESELSLMPENLGEALPPAELNDLMAFLLSKRGTVAK